MNFSKKIGILGGGQLGRMLQEIGLTYGINLNFLDSSDNCPCGIFRDFKLGDIQNYEDVIEFGSKMDVVTVEIEHIHTDALHELTKRGVEVIPNPSVLEMIKNKKLQKEFYQNNQIPTSPFISLDSVEGSEETLNSWIPFVQKSQTDGYDGKGVYVVNSIEDLKGLMTSPSIIERKIEIEKELATTIVVNRNQSIIQFPIVEMVFDPELNLVDYIIAPASIDQAIQDKVSQIALKLGSILGSPGIYSIEFFLTREHEVIVNEIAPRTHNSAHYTIEGTSISQFEAQLRLLLGLEIPNPTLSQFAGMINLIGDSNHQGKPTITHIESLCSINNAHIHWYGKEETKPGRKMGHITLLNKDKTELIKNINQLKNNLKIQST